MNGTLSRITAPAVPLLSIAEARDHCRGSDGLEDALIEGFVASAEAYLDARDGVLGEALVTQTWRLTLSAAPAGSIEIPLGPVQSIASIGYVDPAGVTRVFAGANYRRAGSVVELVAGAIWPATDAREAAFWVEFVAGYGAPTALPGTVRNLAASLVAHLYDNRDAVGDTDFSPVFKHLFAAARSHRGLF